MPTHTVGTHIITYTEGGLRPPPRRWAARPALWYSLWEVKCVSNTVAGMNQAILWCSGASQVVRHKRTFGALETKYDVLLKKLKNNNQLFSDPDFPGDPSSLIDDWDDPSDKVVRKLEHWS